MFKVRKILLEWLPWLLMMSRPGVTYRRGKSLELTFSQSKPEEPEPVDTTTFSEENASELQIILLHRVYSELKEVLKSLTFVSKSEATSHDPTILGMLVIFIGCSEQLSSNDFR